MDKQRFYNWADTFSRQTGHQGEICIVVGAKGIGKTFGLRRHKQGRGTTCLVPLSNGQDGKRH